MSWVLGETWVWILLAALLGAGVTVLYTLRKVAVSTVRATTVVSPVDQVRRAEPAEVVPGPYPGSAAAREDRSMPEGHPIKGNARSMLFHTPTSPYYTRTVGEVWFDTEEHAEAAGFRRWDRH